MKKGIFYCYLLAAVFTISACSIQKNKEASEYNNNIVENSSTTSFNEASDDFNRYLQENVGKKSVSQRILLPCTMMIFCLFCI